MPENEVQETLDNLVDEVVNPSEGEQASASDEENEGSEEAGLSPEDGLSEEEKIRREEQSKRDRFGSLLEKSDERTDALLARYGYSKESVSSPQKVESQTSPSSLEDDDAIVTVAQLKAFKDELVGAVTGQVGQVAQMEEKRAAMGYLVEEMKDMKDYLTEEDMTFAKNFVEDLSLTGTSPTDAAIYVKEILQGRASRTAMKQLATKVEREAAEKVRKIKQGQTPSGASAPPPKTGEVDPIIESLIKARQGVQLFDEKKK
jgi:hypothetical protein